MADRRPTLCVVAGPNGSGKTTTTVQLLNNEWAADSLYINPDNIALEVYGDWNSHDAVLKAAEQRFMNGGHEVPISKVVSRYYKSLINAEEAISIVDRAYVYDNSVDNQLPRLLYRTVDGNLVKKYTDDIPEWAKALASF